MQAVILAAGRGTRMGELTNDIPKPLLKIKGRSIVEYTMYNLPQEIDEVIFVIGYKGEMIKEHFGNEWEGKKIKYVEQRELNGTGAAVFATKDLIKDRFLALNGDDLYHREDLEKMLPYQLAVLVKEVENNDRFGVIKTDQEGYLKQIIEFKDLKEKNGDNLVNTGAYMLNREIFNYPLAPIFGGKEFGLPQTLAQMADKHKIKVVSLDVWHSNTQEEDLIKGKEVVDKHFNHLVEN